MFRLHINEINEIIFVVLLRIINQVSAGFGMGKNCPRVNCENVKVADKLEIQNK